MRIPETEKRKPTMTLYDAFYSEELAQRYVEIYLRAFRRGAEVRYNSAAGLKWELWVME